MAKIRIGERLDRTKYAFAKPTKGSSQPADFGHRNPIASRPAGEIFGGVPEDAGVGYRVLKHSCKNCGLTNKK